MKDVIFLTRKWRFFALDTAKNTICQVIDY